MSGSRIGALKAAAARIGVSYEEYRAHREAGEQWCSGCRDWHPEGLFGGKRGYCAASYRRINNEATQRRERAFLDHLLARLLVK